MTATIRVLLVDDDPMVRTGLKMILGGAPSIDVIGEAENGEVGLAMIASERPDVVLLDIRMPVLDGLAGLSRLKETGDTTRVAVLTTYHTDADALEALRHGAAGFLLKAADPAEMVAAVEAIHRGDPVLSPAVTGTVIAAVAGAAPTDTRLTDVVTSLTDREREVAVLMARGKTNADIGADLFMSLATVKAHLTKVFTKLGVDNRVSAAMAIRDAGLLD